MKIIPATAEQTKYIAETFNAVFTFHKAIRDMYTTFDEEVLHNFIESQDLTFVAMSDTGEYVGAVIGNFIPHPTDRVYPYAALRNIWVEESARNQGLGEALLRAFENLAKEKGAVYVDLHVDVQNNLALSFWDSADYTVYQERRTKYLK